MAHRRLCTLDISPSVLSHAKRVGFKTVQDVLQLPLVEVMKQLCLSSHQAKELLTKLYGYCAPKHSTLLEILSDNQGPTITFRDKVFSEFLGGGFFPSSIIEFAGPAGVGKTQWCLEVSVLCLTHPSGPRHVTYIDTEAAFKPKRVVEMLSERLPSSEHHRIPDLLSRVIVHQPTSIGSLEKIIKQLEVSAALNQTTLVVVDSIASLARKEFPPYLPGSKSMQWKRVHIMGEWVARLKTLAFNRKLVVILTNQVTSKRLENRSYVDNDSETEDAQREGSTQNQMYITPALGTTWTHFVNTRIILQFTAEKSYRQLQVVKSPVCPFACFDYSIASEGVNIRGRGEYSFRGCDPTQQKLNVQTGEKLKKLH